jgi:hypothetical protein
MDRNRQHQVDVVTLPSEHWMVRYLRRDIEVAGRPAAHARVSLPWHPDARTVADAGRDADLHGLAARFEPGATARLARLRALQAGSAASGAAPRNTILTGKSKEIQPLSQKWTDLTEAGL